MTKRRAETTDFGLWKFRHLLPPSLSFLSYIDSSPMSSSSSSALSFRQSLLLTALGASVLTSGVILAYQSLRREHRTERLKREVGKDVEEWEKRRAESGAVTPEERVEYWNSQQDKADVGFGPGAKGARRQKKAWETGEFDESLIREQVSCRYNGFGRSWGSARYPAG